jgi:hypothetical protein
VDGEGHGEISDATKYPWRFSTLNLRTLQGWQELYKLLSGSRSEDEEPPEDTDDDGDLHRAAAAIIEQLRALEVKGAVVEFPYHDRDFSEEYVTYHARLFRPGRRACTRIHFFDVPSEDLDHVVLRDVIDPRKRQRQLKAWAHFRANRGIYRGFAVCRPTRDVPLGFTVIPRPPSDGTFGRVLRTTFTVHLLGQDFKVHGFPFMEQDARTGSCAQAALWSALRYLWAAEGSSWRSVPAITRAATSVPDEINALSVPSGSGGLQPANMIRAVLSADRFPHYFCSVPALEDGRYVFKWKNELDPIAIACRYLDSEIPVILLVGHTSSRLAMISQSTKDTVRPPYEALEVENGHAITAIGYYGNPSKNISPAASDDHLHAASWVDGFVIQNDQAGPYLKLPRSLDMTTDLSGEPTHGHYTCGDIFGLIIPLPDKVFLRADRAEEYAWMFVTEKADELWNDVGRKISKGQNSNHTLDPKTLVARTFLTRGYKHYQWLAAVNAHPELQRLAAALHHPRNVWITEFYRLNNGVPDFEHIAAHVVADATASGDTSRSSPYNAFMFAHTPGRGFALLTTGRPGGASLCLDGSITTICIRGSICGTVDRSRRRMRPCFAHRFSRCGQPKRQCTRGRL